MNFIEHPSLYRALGQLIESDKYRSETVERDLWNIYGMEATVVVIDMTQFTKVTQAHGIVYYLSLIKRMQDCVSICIPRFNGTLIKFSADNAFLIFDTVEEALTCLIDINKQVEKENNKTPDKHNIELCSGLDHGKILNIDNCDLFGDAVNIASKLGEDCADSGEVLISKRAMGYVEPGKYEYVDYPNEFCEAYRVIL
ncbi:adenylate/guanylate cyclase domain-containing protein [Aestuariibacter salexigens]|uniref:adenylate/guanylate cyclase domain-containing protein n=1 Tax=Aestuariibacter salexigens TaxID=226010 RepID=UPI0004790ADF|nr:adenylate/guanylate cyclase domain-containing protein [Aestuariibacter salexigens]